MKKSDYLRRNTLTTYIPVDQNIYHDGNSFRVRVSIGGKRHSKSFPKRRLAQQHRDELFSSR